MEKRYAIIIGINDYDSNPLEFCANDACEVARILEEKCRFNKDDIFLIASESGNSIKDITGRYREALRKIRDIMIAGEDSILFYFAGHGSNEFNKSNLYFHDSIYPIEEIYKDISQLNPKFQFYIIDSCKSGGKVLTRDDSKINEKMISDYILNSSGIMFLYACQYSEVAGEYSDRKHGLLTYYFLESINNDDLYDKDNILTPGRIQEYVSKETSKASGFSQNPVTENRITGYYPFAFKQLKDTSGSSNVRENNGIQQSEEVRELSDYGMYNRNFRIELQEFVYNELQPKLLDFVSRYEPEYGIHGTPDPSDYELSNLEYLYEEIVEDTIKSKLGPLNNTFLKKKHSNPQYFSSSMIQAISLLSSFEENKKEIPKFIIDYSIDFKNEFLQSSFIKMTSSTLRKTSFGLGLLIYQVKWGLVASFIGFMIDWDGERDSVVKDIIKYDYPILLEQQSFEAVKNLNIVFFKMFEEYMEKWNIRRSKELDEFINLAHKSE